ncbi:MAG TPA: hypothetical protein VLY20_05685, partial [Nitrospiria bacterium]|nr:hypothetical protein [Nitrospiria bacterium]
MPKNRFTVKNSLNVEQDIAVKATPDTCPCCHKGIQPSFCFSFIHDSDTPTTSVINAEVVFRCPLQKCQRLFIAYYSAAALRGQSVMEFGLNGLLPYTHENTKFPESVEKLSPKFCEIYNEAAWAESLKLLNVAGPGYRKALEFLVKDNVCAEEPGETEKII